MEEWPRKVLHEWLNLPLEDQKYISKDDLVVGQFYICKSRNFKLGMWNGTSFNYIRVKSGYIFNDTEYHWDDGSPHGTVKPIRRLT